MFSSACRRPSEPLFHSMRSRDGASETTGGSGLRAGARLTLTRSIHLGRVVGSSVKVASQWLSSASSRQRNRVDTLASCHR